MQRDWMAMLRRRAHELGKSLERVARDAGLTRSYLYELATGRTEAPNIRTLVHLAHALEVSPVSVLRHYVDFHTPPRRATARTAAERLPCSRAVGLDNPEDVIVFNADITVPDHSAVKAGEAFRKIWEVQNQGQAPWIKRRLVRADQHYAISRKAADGKLEPIMQPHLICQADDIPIPDVMPGECRRLEVDFVAPSENCSVASIWRVCDDARRSIYAPAFFLQVIVTVIEQ
ncbi:MAG: NBR1-Ig-like domain-containing protein [Aquabacterium sp.]